MQNVRCDTAQSAASRRQDRQQDARRDTAQSAASRRQDRQADTKEAYVC